MNVGNKLGDALTAPVGTLVGIVQPAVSVAPLADAGGLSLDGVIKNAFSGHSESKNHKICRRRAVPEEPVPAPAEIATVRLLVGAHWAAW